MGYPTPSGDFKRFAELSRRAAELSAVLALRLEIVEDSGRLGPVPEGPLEQLSSLSHELVSGIKVVIDQLGFLDAQIEGLRYVDYGWIRQVDETLGSLYTVRDVDHWTLGSFGYVYVNGNSDHPARAFVGRPNTALSLDDVAPESIDVVMYSDGNEGDPEWDALVDAVHDLVRALGYSNPETVETLRASIFRRDRWRRRFAAPAVKERLAKLEHAVDLQAITRHQAAIDSEEALAFANVLGALGDCRRACVRVGSILVVRYPVGEEAVTLARTLSLTEMVALDKYPEIQRSPENAFDALATALAEIGDPSPPGLGPPD
ncbi:MAG: hypothetical protein JWR83_1494 [Aeromicrobium sp.]|nr:hypothetical protein [Aeromicrobium sp.]